MKNLLLTVVFVLTANFAVAQTQAFKDDVKKVITLSGSAAQIDVARKQVLSMIPAEKQADFLKEFEESLKPFFATMESFYLTEFTHDDIKQMIKYYESPIGKKVSSKSGILTEKSMQAAQEWSMTLQGIMMKYMQQ